MNGSSKGRKGRDRKAIKVYSESPQQVFFALDKLTLLKKKGGGMNSE